MLWSGRYDRTLEDAFSVQDELTQEIVTALDVELLGGEQARHRRSRVHSAEAGQILYKGLYEHYKYDRSAAVVARQCFEEVIRLEPDSILGYVWLVTSYAFAIVVGWENPRAALPMFKEWVDKSLAIDPDDEQIIRNHDLTRAMLGYFPSQRRPGESAAHWAARLNNAGYGAMLAGNRTAARSLFARSQEASEVHYSRVAENQERLENEQ